jgi:hypothetical protein
MFNRRKPLCLPASSLYLRPFSPNRRRFHLPWISDTLLSMIISHKYKFIFLRTRKTAGTSIEIALSEFCGADDIITWIEKEDEAIRTELGYRGPQNSFLPFFKYKYHDLKKLVRTFQPKAFANHNPARFIRQYAGLEIWNTYYKFCFERNPFDKAISRYYFSTRPPKPRPSISKYLASVRVDMLSNWSIYTINDHVAVDFVGRYEKLDEDLQKIAETLGLPSRLSLPRAKSKFRENREHYSKVLNPQDRTRIERVCAKEIGEFAYRWEEPENP